MYRAFLAATGLHRPASGGGTLGFHEPHNKSLKRAWKVIRQQFKRAKTRRLNLRDIYAALLSPPIGMKGGVIPVFLTAALLAYRDEIAIYEHGTFKPVLAADLSERMVRNPGHFEIKHFANTTGARGEVVAALAKASWGREWFPSVSGCQCGCRGRLSRLDGEASGPVHVENERYE